MREYMKWYRQKINHHPDTSKETKPRENGSEKTDPETKYQEKEKIVNYKRGSQWEPTESTVICSEHFVDGAPSENSKRINYAPALFEYLNASKKEKKFTNGKNRTVSLKTFAKEYIKFDALLEQPTEQNAESVQRITAFVLLARILGISVPMAHSWEKRFRKYFESKIMSLAVRDNEGNLSLSSDTPTWVRFVESKLNILAAINEKLSQQAASKRLSPSEVVSAFCDAARARGVLCSSALYADVRRALKISCPINDLHAVWVSAQRVCLEQVLVAGRAGDKASSAAPPDAAAVADLVILHTDVAINPLLTDESLSLYEECAALHTLWQLVQRHRLEEAPASAPVSPELRRLRWSRAHKEYLNGGRMVSILVLQRRWHELKVQARDRLAAHWHCEAGPRPSSLHIAVLKRYPHIATGTVKKWQQLVKEKLVVIDPLETGLDEEDEEKDEIPISPDIETKNLHVDEPKDNNSSGNETTVVKEPMICDHPCSDTLADGNGDDFDQKPSVHPPGDDDKATIHVAPVSDNKKTVLETMVDDKSAISMMTSAIKREPILDDTEENSAVPEFSNNTPCAIKQEPNEHTDMDIIDTESTHTSIEHPIVEALHTIDPSTVKMEIQFDSDEDEFEPNVNNDKAEFPLEIKPDPAFISTRLIFEDELPEASDVVTGSGDDVMSGGDDVTRGSDDVSRGGDDVTKDKTSSDETPAIDEKLLMETRIQLIRIDQTRAWKKHSVRNKSISVHKLDKKIYPDVTQESADRHLPKIEATAIKDLAINEKIKILRQNIKRELMVEQLAMLKEIPNKIARFESDSDDDDDVPLSAFKTEGKEEKEWKEEEGGTCQRRSMSLAESAISCNARWGSLRKRVQLPDMRRLAGERQNRVIQVAQVAPISHHDNKASTDDSAEENSFMSDAIFDDTDSYERPAMPPKGQLERVLSDLLTQTSAEHVLEGGVCCSARRHRLVNDTRRSIGAPLIPLHNHADGVCTCCCAHLCDDGAKQRLNAQLAALHNDIAKILQGCSSTSGSSNKKKRNKNKSSYKLNKKPATSNPPAKKETTESKAPLKEAHKKQRKRDRPKHSPTKPPATNKSTTPEEDYQEWLRQKNMNAQYFHIAPVPKKDKTHIPPPNTEPQPAPLNTTPLIVVVPTIDTDQGQSMFARFNLTTTPTNDVTCQHLHSNLTQPNIPIAQNTNIASTSEPKSVSILEEYSRTLQADSPTVGPISALSVSVPHVPGHTILLSVTMPKRAPPLYANDTVDLTEDEPEKIQSHSRINDIAVALSTLKNKVKRKAPQIMSLSKKLSDDVIEVDDSSDSNGAGEADGTVEAAKVDSVAKSPECNKSDNVPANKEATPEVLNSKLENNNVGSIPPSSSKESTQASTSNLESIQPGPPKVISIQPSTSNLGSIQLNTPKVIRIKPKLCPPSNVGSIKPSTSNLESINPSTSNVGSIEPSTSNVGSIQPSTPKVISIQPSTSNLDSQPSTPKGISRKSKPSPPPNVGSFKPSTSNVGSIRPSTSNVESIQPSAPKVIPIKPKPCSRSNVGSNKPSTLKVIPIRPKPCSTSNVGSIKPSTSNEESIKPSTSNEESIKSSSSNEESIKPSTSNEESIKPSSSNEESNKPSSSNEESIKPSTSNEESIKPSSSNEESIKPSNSNVESIKPSTSNEESIKPSNSNEESIKPSTSNVETIKLCTLNVESIKPSSSKVTAIHPCTSNLWSSMSTILKVTPRRSKPNIPCNVESIQPSTSNAGPSQSNTTILGSSQPETSNVGSSQPDTSNVGSSQPDTSNVGSSNSN